MFNFYVVIAFTGLMLILTLAANNPFIFFLLAAVTALYYNIAKKKEIVDEYIDEPLTEEHELVLFKHAKYNYLKSADWCNKRKEVLRRDNYQCCCCGESDNLQVHHDAGYNLIPHEPISSLRTLCGTCHKNFHDRHGYPQTYKEYMEWDTTSLKN